MIDLFKLLAVLAGILFLLWRRWNLGVVLLIASAVIGLLFGRSALGLLEDGYATIVAPITLRLAAIVALILTLGALLKATAKLKGMVQSLEAIVPDGRVTSAVIPALIGMLPMAGGAIFSAPMVDEVGDRLNIDRNRKTFVNYWFRHVWEWVLPTYPSLILAAALLGLTPRELVLSQWPLTVTAIGAGILFGLAPIKAQGRASTPSRGKNGDLKLLAASIWPIVLVITLSVPLKIDLILALLITITLLALANRLVPRQFWKILREGVSLKPVALIVAVMLFRQVLDSTGAVTTVPDTLTTAGIPVPVILFFIPMLAGLLTGLAAGTYGVSFPVIMPLLLAGEMSSGAVALAFTGGFLGVLLSPLHLCLSLTRDYYEAEWGPIYRMLVPAVAAAAAMAVVLFALN